MYIYYMFYIYKFIMKLNTIIIANELLKLKVIIYITSHCILTIHIYLILILYSTIIFIH